MCHDNIYLTPYLYPESWRSTEGLHRNSHDVPGRWGQCQGDFGGQEKGFGI